MMPSTDAAILNSGKSMPSANSASYSYSNNNAVAGMGGQAQSQTRQSTVNSNNKMIINPNWRRIMQEG